MAATLDRSPGFVDGDVLPAGWHWLYFHDVVEASRLGRDGHPALGVSMPPIAASRRMWAGGDLAFAGSLRMGETVHRTSSITDITPKLGRSGPMHFVNIQHEASVDGETRILEQQTIVYLESDRTTSDAPTPLEAPGSAAFERTWELDETTLFRYSALTINSHRIHYDLDYARGVERYPGLVIHGPLLATLLMDLACEHFGPLAEFSYRARAPLFVPQTVLAGGVSTPTGANLWAASNHGVVGMRATATYKEGK